MESGRDDRSWRAEQRCEDGMTVEAALPCGSQAAGEDVLSHCPTRRSIAAVSDLPSIQRLADRLFSSPVGRIDRESKQEGEQGAPLPVQMLDEATNGGDTGRLLQRRR